MSLVQVNPAPGSLYVISAPSGAGKTSLVSALLEDDSHVRLSISHTTRAPRSAEQPGVSYHFVDRPTFVSMIGQGAFMEHAEVFGNFYGTSHDSVNRAMEAGADVILEIDWQGAQQIRRTRPDCITVFILPPSLPALKQRLQNRGQDSAEVIERRLKEASEEISHYGEYDYLVVNETFDVALKDLKAIFRAERLRRSLQQLRYESVLSHLISGTDNSA
ncbi:MAG: guanylate kinase [Hahellaceae bacterium]|jgi:guanylate kinase|nr:guanylate kinase [Hahellaceae bacterium]